MRQNGRERAGRAAPPPPLTALAAVGLAGVILFAGTWLAGALRQKGDELVVAEVFRQEGGELAGMENAGRRGKTMELLEQYLFAFFDAAIRFDTIPKLDTQAFLSIATAMPDDVTAEKIEFEHYDIRLTCRAGRAESLRLFSERLAAGNAFDEVRFTGAQPRPDGGWAFEVICSPREKEGTLAFGFPGGG